MARIPTYQKDTHISDLDRIIGTDGDTNELATKNFFLGDIAEYVIDKFIDPDAVSFTIPLFRDTQDVLGSNATRITGSIISQDTNPDGTKITIAGNLTVGGNNLLIEGTPDSPTLEFSAANYDIAYIQTGPYTAMKVDMQDGLYEMMGDFAIGARSTISPIRGKMGENVSLWYLNNIRFQTTNTGIDVFGNVDMQSNGIINLSNPINPQDAATKAYVDTAAESSEVVEVPVKNLQGSALAKGDPVYISGSVGASGKLEVKLADASDEAKMPALGLLKQDLAINEEGFAVVTGKLRNLATSPIDGQTPLANDVIYVKANSTTGAALTLTKPTGSSLIQNMGKVGRVSTSNDGTFIVSSILRTNDIPNIPRGSIWVGDAAGVANPLPIGTAGKVLASDGTDVNWEDRGTGTTNTLPLWSDGSNGVLADSILSQDTNPTDTGLVDPGNRIKTDGTLGVKDSLTVNYTDGTYPRVFPPYQPTGDFNTEPTGRIGVVNDVNTLEWAFSAVSIGGLASSEYSNRSGLLHRSGGGYRLLLSNATEQTIFLDSDGDSFINSGNLAIGHDTPTEKLDVLGDIKATNIRTERVRPQQGGTVVKINQANFFDTGNISNISNTDIGATLHLRTNEPLTDQDVIALTKGGLGTGFPSGIKQSAGGEYTFLLRDNSNSQSIKLASNKTTPSFIDNGKVFLGGNTDQQDGAVTINNRRWTNGVKNAVIQFNKSGTQLDTALEFKQGSILKGSISYDSTGTNYNVTSDYRVKENVVEITDGIERLKQLKPSKFNFITDTEKVVDGFIAHEVQDVVPEAVTGDKDATEEYEVTPAEYDDYGNLITEAVMGTRDAYQQIDQAKIVPLLTAALQEAITKIETLEAKVNALEGN